MLLVKLTAGKGKQHQDVEEAELTDVEDHSAQYHLEQRTLLERRKINKILIRRCMLVISTSGKYKLISFILLTLFVFSLFIVEEIGERRENLFVDLSQ